jgi:hypothetical protein
VIPSSCRFAEVQDHGAEASRAVQEYLATLDDAAFKAASEVTPKFVSPANPAAQWTGLHKGHASFGVASF